MDQQVFFLLMLLFLTINGQSTTTVEENEKQTTNNLEETKSTVATSGDLQAAESTVRYTVVEPGDEKKTKPDNDITPTIDDDDTDELLLIQRLLGGEDKIVEETFPENNTNDKEDDTGVKFVLEENEDPFMTSNTHEIEMRYPIPEFEQPIPAEGEIDEIRDNGPNPSLATTPYESNSDNSPVLQLTQGGYQRPFQAADMFSDQQQKLSTESTTQQDERVETLSNNQQRVLSRMPSQSTFSPMFQPPFMFGPGPILRHPFIQRPNSFDNPNGAVPSSIQNSFYNTQPDYNQGQFSQLNSAGDFPNVHFTVQSTPRAALNNPEYMFQNPNPFDFPFAQPMPAHSPRISPFIGSGSPVDFSGLRSAVNSNGVGFSPFLTNTNSPSQETSNLNGGTPNFAGNFFSNPSLSLMSNYPILENRFQFNRPLNPMLSQGQASLQNLNNQQQVTNPPSNDATDKEAEPMKETPNKEDPVSVPFGVRIQRPNNEPEPSDLERQDNVYIRYPMTEAGYAKEETLPVKNETEKKENDRDNLSRPPLPFFSVPRHYNVFQGPDPYRIALENIQRGYPGARREPTDNRNGTDGNQPEQFDQNVPFLPGQIGSNVPDQIFRAYPERNPELQVPNAPFYPLTEVSSERNPFEPLALFPDNRYQFPSRSIGVVEQNVTPTCAENNNTFMCFVDPEYPRTELLYALNSDSFLTERLVMPDQQLDGIPLLDQNITETPENEDNYICKSEIKYGLPLRAKNIKGKWKIIVNMERAVSRGNFIQPVRLEICRGAGSPCNSVTEIKTSCVQKYSLQRLLSWSLEKGVHNDVYRLPVACSCQILQTKA